jgi:hypothetical protein
MQDTGLFLRCTNTPPAPKTWRLRRGGVCRFQVKSCDGCSEISGKCSGRTSSLTPRRRRIDRKAGSGILPPPKLTGHTVTQVESLPLADSDLADPAASHRVASERVGGDKPVVAGMPPAGPHVAGMPHQGHTDNVPCGRAVGGHIPVVHGKSALAATVRASMRVFI